MKVERIEQFDKRFGWSILIKDFSKKDYKNLILILTKLGMKRYLKMEKELNALAKKGYSNYLEEGYSSRFKRYLGRINYTVGHFFNKFSKKRLISRIYLIDDNQSLNFGYLPSARLFSGTFRNDELSGEDFVSVLLSYQ